MKRYYVYRIVCLNSQKFYIGSSYDPYKRFLTHFNKCKKKSHSSPLLQFEVDSGEMIKLEILSSFDSEYEAKEEELKLLNLYWESGLLLNDRKISTGTDYISNHTNKDFLISNKAYAYHVTVKSGAENPNYRHGKYVKSKAFCRDCGVPIHIGREYCKEHGFLHRRDYNGNNNPFYGKTHSKETIELLRNRFKGIPNLSCSKKVSIDGVEYVSASEASRQTGIKLATICHRAKRKIKNTFYVDE